MPDTAELRRRLTSMDAFFLYLETEEQPMHVGVVCILEGRLSWRKFLQGLHTRLDMVPRYRQRVVFPPWNVGHPTWENDPDFEIERHAFRHKLAAPGSEEQLRELTGEIWTGTLKRDRPLWQAHFVEGLEQDRTAVIFKVHHCMVDGVAGVGLLYVMMDLEPDPPKVRRRPYKADPLPDAGRMLYDALWDTAIDGVEHLTRLQRSVVEFSRGLAGKPLSASLRKFGGSLGNFLLPFKHMPFNAQLGGQRLVTWREFAFADARMVRKALGGTVNDVILTVLGGAVLRYLDQHPDADLSDFETLRVLAPVNVRTETERGALGNRISFMPVQVPLHRDPVERLRATSELTKELKEHKVPEAVGLMFEVLQGSPAALQALSLSTMSNPVVQLAAGRMAILPPGNMICTNVPGPQIPLYTMGHRILALYPKVPCALEMGVNVALMSYDQKFFVTFVADGQAAHDFDLLMEYFDESFKELRTAAEVTEAPYVPLRGSNRAEPATNGRARNRRPVAPPPGSKTTKH